jgi:UDP-N-acetylmuramoyl-tripeptide--D-alanyl-D-alanine ligase
MGDMVELGKDTKTFHAEIGMFAKKRGINKFLSIGVNSKFASDVFGLNGYHFENAESLKSYLNNNLESSSVILIKGSRSAKLEEYVEFLKTRSL